MDVEATSVAYVQLLIGECPHLTPFIDQKDKVLFTDGHIDIRSDKSQPTDTNFSNRAQVQVKGRTLGKNRKPPKTFSLKREKLTAYLKIRGLLLLVVYIGKNAEKYVRYALLTPLELDHLLKQSPKQKSFPINLNPFPEEHVEIEAIVRYMAQAHNENPEALASESVWERVSDISIFATHRLDTNKPIRLNPTEHDFTVKLTTQDGAQAFARSEEFLLVPKSYIGRPLGRPVKGGDVTFGEPMVRKVSEDTVALDLSETLSLHRNEPVNDGAHGLIEWGMNDSFDKRLKDLGFILSAVDNGGYFVGDEFFNWDLGALKGEEALRRHYRHLQRTAELFEYVQARTDLIDLSKVEEKRHRQLWHLYEAVIEKKEMTPDQPSRPGRIRQPIGDWALDLVVRKGSEEGKFRIYHLLDPELQYVFYSHDESSEGPAGFPVTAYEVLKEDRDFSEVLNLGLDRVVDLYGGISEYDHTKEVATDTVLALITAADRAPARQSELLAAAERLNAWIAVRYGEAPSHVVNALQIHRRRRALTGAERSRLRELRRQVLRGGIEMAEVIAFSCSVLLDDMEEAGDHFQALPTGLQEMIQEEWPIWSLWKTDNL